MVIAIIAILAAILFPVFAKAREKARQSSCASNEKQIGLGIMQYVQDYDEMFGYRKTTSDGSDSDNMATSWKVNLQPYIKSIDIFKCPSNPNKNQFDNATANCNTNAPFTGMSCGPRSYLNNTVAGGTSTGIFGSRPANNDARALAQITSPASVIIVGEYIYEQTDYRVDVNCCGFTNGIYAGHSGMTNWLFADGHVKSLKPLSTLSRNMGGSGDVYMWAVDNMDNAGQANTAMNNLKNAQNLYQ